MPAEIEITIDQWLLRQKEDHCCAWHGKCQAVRAKSSQANGRNRATDFNQLQIFHENRIAFNEVTCCMSFGVEEAKKSQLNRGQSSRTKCGMLSITIIIVYMFIIFLYFNAFFLNDNCPQVQQEGAQNGGRLPEAQPARTSLTWKDLPPPAENAELANQLWYVSNSSMC